MKTINTVIVAVVLLALSMFPQNVSANNQVGSPLQQAPMTLKWENKADMLTPRWSMGAAVSGGKVYVIGGDNGSCVPMANNEEFNPLTNTWSIQADMPTGRWLLDVATGGDGKIYAIGGAGGDCGSVALGTVEAYDPTTNGWEVRANMPTPRMELGVAAATNGKIYAFGGENLNSWLATVEEYDTATNTWTQKANMPYPNKNFSITAASNGKIYLMGGEADINNVWEYDPAADSWNLLTTNPWPRFRTAATQASNGQIYVIGGELGGIQGTVSSYNIANNSWSAETSLTTPRIAFNVVAVGDMIYALGGWNNGPLSSVEAGTVVAVLSPANDNFVDAMVIQSLPFSDVQDTTWATTEYGEPQHCVGSSRTIWYAYTPAANQSIIASMAGSSFDTNISIYQQTGAGMGGLSFVGCATGGFDFIAHKGVTYYLQVGANAMGDLHLDIQEGIPLPPPPVNDDFDFAIPISTLPFNDVVDITYASRELGEPQNCNFSPQTVWYKITPTTNTEIRVGVEGTMFSDTVISAYQATDSSLSGLSAITCNTQGGPITFSVQAGVTYYIQAGNIYSFGGELHINVQENIPPPNDNFANAITISSSLPFDDTVDIKTASMEAGEPISSCASYGNLWKTVWYAYTPETNKLISASIPSATFVPVLAVYTGNSLTNLTELGCQSYTSNEMKLYVEAGTTYYFQVGKHEPWYPDGPVQFQLKELNPPVNDNFNNATEIGTFPFSNTVDITDATTESGEPWNCYSSTKTVWYTFTPDANMWIQVDLYGGNLWDGIFNVYQATVPNPGISDLSPVQCAGFGNSATFTVQAGVKYYIQAGSYYGNNGSLHLNLKRLAGPVNDDFENATLISSLPFDNTVNIQYSLRQTGEPTPSCASYSPGTQSVWYAFSPETSGSVSARIPSAAFTPIFAVYTGNSLNNLTQIGCQTYSNLLTFRANAGTTYYFQVGNYYSWESSGSIQFHLDIAPQPIDSFYYSPSDPSIFDTIQFYDSSYDPGQVGFQSYSWNFGDGTTSNSLYPTHKYAKDGDYTVQHAVTTVDGRTASITQVVHVKTHDVAITKISAPLSASSNQSRAIVVSVKSKTYAETVRVELYKSVPGGFELIGYYTQLIPARSANRTTSFTFNYTFTSGDASIGKVTFKAVATIVDARDAYPSDNEAISSPPTKVSRGR